MSTVRRNVSSSVRRGLYFEVLEDRRLLSGANLLPLADNLADAPPALRQGLTATLSEVAEGNATGANVNLNLLAQTDRLLSHPVTILAGHAALAGKEGVLGKTRADRLENLIARLHNFKESHLPGMGLPPRINLNALAQALLAARSVPQADTPVPLGSQRDEPRAVAPDNPTGPERREGLGIVGLDPAPVPQAGLPGVLSASPIPGTEQDLAFIWGRGERSEGVEGLALFLPDLTGVRGAIFAADEDVPLIDAAWTLGEEPTGEWNGAPLGAGLIGELPADASALDRALGEFFAQLDVLGRWLGEGLGTLEASAWAVLLGTLATGCEVGRRRLRRARQGADPQLDEDGLPQAFTALSA